MVGKVHATAAVAFPLGFPCNEGQREPSGFRFVRVQPWFPRLPLPRSSLDILVAHSFAQPFTTVTAFWLSLFPDHNWVLWVVKQRDRKIPNF